MSQSESQNARAIIVATNGRAQFATGQCSPMMPLVDRPFVQHVVECVIDQGFKQIDFVLADHAEDIEALFADGKRWGVEFRYHLARDENKPYSRVRSILSANADDRFLLLHADTLLPHQWIEAGDSSDGFRVYESIHPEEENDRRVTATWLQSSVTETLDFAGNRSEFEASLLRYAADYDATVSTSTQPLSAVSFRDLIDSQHRALNGEFPETYRFHNGTEEKINIGRNVYLTTRGSHFEPPVYIGSNCTIEGDVRLGPNVVISDGTYINSKCEVSNTLIMRDSLVGEGLAMNGCVLDRHQLFHAEHDVSVSMDDELIMGSTRSLVPGADRIRRACSRVGSYTILLLFSPILMLLAICQWIRHGKAFEREPLVRLPIPEGVSAWKTFERIRFKTSSRTYNSNGSHFLFDVLPGLLNVARGEINLVGVTPLTSEELNELPAEMRETYLTCHAGLINESTVIYGQSGTRDEILMAEMFYAATVKSVFSRIKRIGAYAVSVVLGPSSQRCLGNLPAATLKARV